MGLYKILMRKIAKGVKPEHRVEAFLAHELDLIEPGLRLVQRQYPLYYIRRLMVGKIDLFCAGEDMADVAIELVAAGPLSSSDLGQMMAYNDVLSTRAELHKRPMPRLYAIGPGMTAAFQHALNVLDGGRQINLKVKLFRPRPEVRLEDEEWAVEIWDHQPYLIIQT